MNVPPPVGPQYPPPYEQPPYTGKKNNNALVIVLVVVGVGGFFMVAILAAILFPVFAQARLAAQRVVRHSRIKQIGFACLMFADDHNDHLPNLTNSQSLESDVKKYFRKSGPEHVDEIFLDPVTRQPFGFNAKLSGVAITGDKASKMLVLYDPQAERTGDHFGFFADGHSSEITEEELHQDTSE